MSHDLSPLSLVLVHGWAGSAEAWAPLIPRFHDAGIQSVHAVRLPGSPGARTASSFTVLSAVEEVVRVAERTEGPTVLIGHSMGAQITLLAQSRLGERLLGEIVIDPAYGADDESRHAHESWSRQIDSEGLPAVDEFFRSALGNMTVSDSAQVLSDLKATSPHVIADYLRSEYVDAHAVGLASATRRHAAARSVPVLAVHSQAAGRDFETSLENPDGSSVEYWPDHGHFLHLEDPARFVSVAVDMIRSWQQRHDEVLVAEGEGAAQSV